MPVKIVALEQMRKLRRNRGSRVQDLPEWKEFVNAIAQGVSSAHGIEIVLGKEQREECGMKNVGGAFKHRAKLHLKTAGKEFDVRGSTIGDTYIITVISKA